MTRRQDSAGVNDTATVVGQTLAATATCHAACWYPSDRLAGVRRDALLQAVFFAEQTLETRPVY